MSNKDIEKYIEAMNEMMKTALEHNPDYELKIGRILSTDKFCKSCGMSEYGIYASGINRLPIVMDIGNGEYICAECQSKIK